MVETDEVRKLKITADRCRRHVIRMMRSSGHGHIGGSFSCIDIVTALYFHGMKIFPENPGEPGRDRFLLSAGHKSMAQYAVLAEKGFFAIEILDTYGHLHSRIPGHPDMHKLPGVEANTGALGHGLSIACGMALGQRMDGKESRVFVVLGDGELPEGSNWEGAAAAAHYGLDNLTVFVDNNGLQISGRVETVMNMTPIDRHFEAFGWAVKNIDGNCMEEIIDTLDQLPLKKGKPSLIVAHTVKCKGMEKGENHVDYHYWVPGADQLDNADQEILDHIRALEDCREQEENQGCINVADDGGGGEHEW